MSQSQTFLDHFDGLPSLVSLVSEKLQEDTFGKGVLSNSPRALGVALLSSRYKYLKHMFGDAQRFRSKQIDRDWVKTSAGSLLCRLFVAMFQPQISRNLQEYQSFSWLRFASFLEPNQRRRYPHPSDHTKQSQKQRPTKQRMNIETTPFADLKTENMSQD